MIAVGDTPARSILVDLDLHFGTAAMMFGVDCGTGFAALLASPDRLDEQLISSSLNAINSRLGIIVALTLVENDAPMATAAATTVLAALRTTAKWVVADVRRGLDATARQLFRTADEIVLVIPPSLVGVRDTGRMLAYLLALRR